MNDLDFTAQTTVASSYGYMQVIYVVAIEEDWTSPLGINHPSELFLTDENLWIGTQHLKRFVNFTFDDAAPEVLVPVQIDQAFMLALQKYNGDADPNYSDRVRAFVPRYLPSLTRPVFPN